MRWDIKQIEMACIPPIQGYGASVTLTFLSFASSPALISAVANIYLKAACSWAGVLPAYT